MSRNTATDLGYQIVICIAATIIDLLLTIPVIVYNDSLIGTFVIVFLGLPWGGSVAGLIYVFVSTYRKTDIRAKVLFYWAICLFIFPWLCFGIVELKNSQNRYSYDLPNGDTLTVWQQTIIFDSYTSSFKPKSNYIRLPNKLEDWSLIIDTTGHVALWVSEKADKVKVCNPKYQVDGVYRDDAGLYWFRVEHQAEERVADYTFHYDRDGIHSGAVMVLHTFQNDSVYSKTWAFSGWDNHNCWLLNDTVYARDSFLTDYNKQTDKSYKERGWSKDGKYYHAYYPDSTEYSFFHKYVND